VSPTREPRVYLRPPSAEDEEEFLGGMRASVELHRPWLYAPLEPLDFLAYLERAARPTSAFNLACRLEDRAIVGFINISEIVRGNMQGAFVGYGAVAEHAGHGYLREAMGLVLAHAFGPLGLHRLEANIQPENAASIALARGQGFELEGFSPRYLRVGGEWRDHERWGIREETWRAASECNA
jgi:[ribosomal protein S5]-alanine N-acetyltransferase